MASLSAPRHRQSDRDRQPDVLALARRGTKGCHRVLDRQCECRPSRTVQHRSCSASVTAVHSIVSACFPNGVVTTNSSRVVSDSLIHSVTRQRWHVAPCQPYELVSDEHNVELDNRAVDCTACLLTLDRWRRRLSESTARQLADRNRKPGHYRRRFCAGRRDLPHASDFGGTIGTPVAHGSVGIGVAERFTPSQWAAAVLSRDNLTYRPVHIGPSALTMHRRVPGITTGTQILQASTSAWGTDGITLNWASVDTAARPIPVLFLKGLQAKAFSFSAATASGNQSVTGLGFQPEALLLASFLERCRRHRA
jgi:hypothetical protein